MGKQGQAPLTPFAWRRGRRGKQVRKPALNQTTKKPEQTTTPSTLPSPWLPPGQPRRVAPGMEREKRHSPAAPQAPSQGIPWGRARVPHPKNEVEAEEQVLDALGASFDRHGGGRDGRSWDTSTPHHSLNPSLLLLSRAAPSRGCPAPCPAPSPPPDRAPPGPPNDLRSPQSCTCPRPAPGAASPPPQTPAGAWAGDAGEPGAGFPWRWFPTHGPARPGHGRRSRCGDAPLPRPAAVRGK